MPVTITPLVSELYARIAALDGSESPRELLFLAKSITPNMSINRSNLNAKLQAKVDAISSESDIEDIMLLAIASNEETKTQVRSIQRLALSGSGNAVISQVNPNKTTVNITSTYAGGTENGSYPVPLTGLYARLINANTVQYSAETVSDTGTIYVEVIEYV